jgi:hypothetical protein
LKYFVPSVAIGIAYELKSDRLPVAVLKPTRTIGVLWHKQHHLPPRSLGKVPAFAAGRSALPVRDTFPMTVWILPAMFCVRRNARFHSSLSFDAQKED